VAHPAAPLRTGHRPQLVASRLQLPEAIREHRHLPHLLLDADELAAGVVALVEPVGVDQPQRPLGRLPLDLAQELVVGVEHHRLWREGAGSGTCRAGPLTRRDARLRRAAATSPRGSGARWVWLHNSKSYPIRVAREAPGKHLAPLPRGEVGGASPPGEGSSLSTSAASPDAGK